MENNPTKPRSVSVELADKLTQIACKQIVASENFRQPRFEQIRELEDMIAGKLKPALKGRYNIPFDSVFANGFVDTLVSQVNKPPRIEWVDTKGSNARGVKKMQALFETETGAVRDNWAKKDRLSKRLAAISGIGIFKYYAESDPKYRSNLSVIDHYDFHCEPNGGGNLEEHLFKGQTNIFRTKADVEASQTYDKEQVKKLLAAYSSKDYKFNEELYRNKLRRWAALGLDPQSNNYVGEELFNFSEWVLTHEGINYYLVFDYRAGIWVRCEKLVDVFGCDRSPWVVWNPKEDPFNVWCRGPLDDQAPIFEAMRINLNEILNNNRKRNWDMRAVDAKMFPDLSLLDWRPDGVVHANLQANQSIQNGVFRFETPEINGALNLNTYLNNLSGINSGISDQTKGSSSQDVLGIAKLDELNLSKRVKLVGDSYMDAYAQLAYRYDWGVHEHLPEGYPVKCIGTMGADMSTITKEDTDPDYDYNVISSQDDLQKTALESEKKANMIGLILKAPSVLARINPDWMAEQMIREGGWNEQDLKRATDLKNFGIAEIISEANKGIEMIMEGKDPRTCYNANAGFLQVITDFINDTHGLSDEKKAKLQAYFDRHVPIAEKNAERAQATAGQQNASAIVPNSPIAPAATPNPNAIPTAEVAPNQPITS